MMYIIPDKQACDEALSTVHDSYEAKLGKVKADMSSQLQLKDVAIEAAEEKIHNIEVPQHMPA